MLSRYFVLQEDETGRKRNKYLFKEDSYKLFVGMEFKINSTLFSIHRITTNNKFIKVICTETIRKYTYETNANSSTPRVTKNDEFSECAKC